MKRLAVVLVTALVGCARHPQPPPLYPKDSMPMDWEIKDLESSCDDSDAPDFNSPRCP